MYDLSDLDETWVRQTRPQKPLNILCKLSSQPFRRANKDRPRNGAVFDIPVVGIELI